MIDHPVIKDEHIHAVSMEQEQMEGSLEDLMAALKNIDREFDRNLDLHLDQMTIDEVASLRSFIRDMKEVFY